MSINEFKVATRKLEDGDPTGGYVGIVHLPGGNDISTCRLRKSRTSAPPSRHVMATVKSGRASADAT